MTWLPPFLIPMSQVPPVAVGAADVPDGLFAAVAGPTALGWIVTYLLALRQARQDGRVAIPPYLIGVNFAWEFSLTFLLEQTPTQRQINFLWLIFDVFLLAQARRYGPRDYPGMAARTFRWTLLGVLVWASAVVMVGANELRDLDGMYTGMIIQVPLSASFILMLRRRGSSVGQSMYIAVAKTVGSLFAGLTAVVVHPQHHLLQVLIVTYVALDIAYLVMLRGVMRREGRPLWAFRRPAPAAGAAADLPAADLPAADLPAADTAPAPAPRAGVGGRSDDATA